LAEPLSNLDKRNTVYQPLVEYALVFLLFIAAELFVTFPIQDFDTFWHMANGRVMAETGHIVNEELYSFTTSGTHFYNHEWLAQVLFFLFYNQWGGAGIQALKAALTFGIMWVLFLTARRLGANRVLAALLCFLVVAAGLYRFTIRPQLFSFLGLSLLGLLLYGYRSGRLGQPALFWLVPIMLLWDFLHGAVYGLIFLGAFLSGETLKYFLQDGLPFLAGAGTMHKQRLRALWAWTSAAVLAMLLNPYGIRTYAMFAGMATNNNATVAMTGEFLPTPFRGYELFWLLFAGTVFLLVRSAKKIDVTELLVFLPFAYLAVRFTRGMEAFNLVALPIVAAHTARIPMAGHDESRHSRYKLVLILCVSLILGYAGYFKFLSRANPDSLDRTSDDYSFGVGINEDAFPVGSVRFIKAVDLKGNMYNTDRYGGYLAYFLAPERKIFHSNFHNIENVLEKYVHDASSREKWNINYALIVREDELMMFTKDNFVPVYWEPSGMILVKQNDLNRNIIDRYRIRYFKPLLSDASLRNLASSPQIYPVLLREMSTYLSYRTDRRIAGLLGEFACAPNALPAGGSPASLLSDALRFNNDSPQLTFALGNKYYREKALGPARTMLARTTELDKNNAAALFNLAYVDYDLGNYTEAGQEFQRLLSIKPEMTDAMYGLALTSYKLKQYGRARELMEKYLQLSPGEPWAEKARAFLSRMTRENQGPEQR